MRDVIEDFEHVSKDNLERFCRSIGVDTAKTKRDMILNLSKVYNSDFVSNNYKLLNPYEKELIDNKIQQKGYPTDLSEKLIEEKYQDKYTKTIYYKRFYPINEFRRSTYFSMNDCIYNELKKIVPTWELNFKETTPIINDNMITIENRLDNLNEIDDIIKYINSKKIMSTKVSKELTKKDIIEIENTLNIKDIFNNYISDVKNIKSINDTTILKGLFNLLVNSGIIINNNDTFIISNKCNEFILLDKVKKIKYLLNDYINSNTIYEINDIDKNIIIDKDPNLISSREYLINIIKKLPIDKWLNYEEFISSIERDNRKFIQGNFKKCYVMEGKRKYGLDFSYLEGRFIRIFILNYLLSLGIVDIIGESRSIAIIHYIRLTNFGAIVLGLKEEVKTKEIDNGFNIDNNFIITIPDGSRSLEYELFFERFLDKNNNGYKLDFKGIAKALDMGISIDEIIEFIHDFGKYTDNVLDMLNIWKLNSNKIKIRTVNIIEFPEEFNKYFTKKELIKNIEENNNSYLIVKDKKQNSIKKEIEKDEIYCDIKNISK